MNLSKDGIMKEETINRILIIKIFLSCILKYTIIMFFIGSLVIFAISTWRDNPLNYIIWFFICLTINLLIFLEKAR